MFGFQGISKVLVATFAMAALSTFADLIWALFIPSHEMIYGLVHGALLFMFMGVLLAVLVASGTASETGSGPGSSGVAKGAAGALVVGLLGAGTFYALFPFVSWAAMFIAWMVVWSLTAILLNRSIRATGESLMLTLGRGAAAAVLSGLAFYAISGIWLGGSTRNPNYVVNFASWFVAFLPAFACLLIQVPLDSEDSSRPQAAMVGEPDD